MAIRIHWFLPTHGDGRDVAVPASGAARPVTRTVRRLPDVDYLAQVAGAAERTGFVGVLVPAGVFCEDPWLVTAALAARTRRLRFMVAFRPGLLSPTLAAQMATTCQDLTGGRLLLNVVTGGDPDEQHRYGDWLPHDARYARTDEFLQVMCGAWGGRRVDLDGRHYRVEGATVMRPAARRPQVFVGGSSGPAAEVAARHADVLLMWGEPPAALAAVVERARAAAAAVGRSALGLGTRFHVIARDTSAQAWAEAERMLADMDPALVARAQQRFLSSDSVGQRRMAALHSGSTDRLEVYPNVWAGYGLLRQGAGAALVGSHAEVAERIEEFHALGFDHLILSGQPHLEEAYEVGEGVLPLLRARGLLADPAVPDDLGDPVWSSSDGGAPGKRPLVAAMASGT